MLGQVSCIAFDGIDCGLCRFKQKSPDFSLGLKILQVCVSESLVPSMHIPCIHVSLSFMFACFRLFM